MERKTVGIIATIATVLFCGLPGLLSICLGAFAMLGAQMPEVMAEQTGTPEEAMLGGAMFICGGLIFLVIPIVVGIVGLRNPKSSQDANFNEPFSPPS